MRFGFLLLATVVALALAAGATATRESSGAPAIPLAFCSGVDVADLKRPYAFQYGLMGAALQAGFFSASGLGSQGYRPRRLTGYRAGAEQLFATKWVQAPGPEWLARFGLTPSEFNALYLERRQSFRPIDVSGYNSPAGVRHAVIWERNTPKVDWRLHRDVSRAGMDKLVSDYAKSGFVPLRVEAYTKAGTTQYISIWVKTACNWRMHNRMTPSEYDGKFAEYSKSHRLVQLDAFVDGGKVFYAGIWWKQPGASYAVGPNRDWYLFQRMTNNQACDGRVIDNFYATDVPGAVRYGGIWTAIRAPSLTSLGSRIGHEVNCAPARAGAAVLNLTTGQQILVNADVEYGTSSTIKSAILFAMLRKIDATSDTLDTMLAAGAPYGTQRGSPTFSPRRSYPLRTFATKMINSSCNWATNRLIDYVGMAQVNKELRDIGVEGVTLRRYMTGSGAPSPRPDSSGPSTDYGDGIDNTATPRDYATFLRLMHENAGRLSRTSFSFYWATLGLNSNAHDAELDAGVSISRLAIGSLAEKAGSNTWSGGPETKPQITGRHYQRSVAGRMTLVNGQTVIYAAFADEGTGSRRTTDPSMQNMLDCVVMHVMREYSGKSTGADVSSCRAG